MSVYSVILTPPAAYPTDPNVVIPFEPKCIKLRLMYTNPGDSATISFDGINDHGKVVVDSTGPDLRGLDFTQRSTRIWVKSVTAGDAQIIAEN